MKTCKNCKIVNPDDAKFCRGCGKNLIETSSSGVWKAIVSIAAIVIIGVCIYIGSRPDPDPDPYPYRDATTVEFEVAPSGNSSDASNTKTDNEVDTNTGTNNASSDNYTSEDTSSSASESSQSIYWIVEVQWTAPDYTIYRGLIAFLSDFTGMMKVTYYHPQYGTTWVTQRAKLTRYADGSYIINCNNPQGDYASTYSADNFKIFPNGTWYTQDNNGVWSTAIVAATVNSNYWSYKLNEYGFN